MKKLFGSKEFVIGLSVIISLVVLFFGIDYLKGINMLRPSNFYYVEYEDVTGLAVASPVSINMRSARFATSSMTMNTPANSRYYWHWRRSCVFLKIHTLSYLPHLWVADLSISN